MAIWICRTNLSNLYLIKIIRNCLRIIKLPPISGFVIGQTQFCSLFKSMRLMRIARICRVHRTTICIWIDIWNAHQRLEDKERSGRPPILNLEEQAKAVEIGLQNPKFPHRQLGEIERATGKEISQGTLKRMLKKRLFVETNQAGVMEKNGCRWERVCSTRLGEIDEKSRQRINRFGVWRPIRV